MKRTRYPGSCSVKRTSKLRDVLSTCNIRRNSTAQLSVSVSGEVYEKAKSRQTRTRAALEQSGSHESAIALGAPGRTKTRIMAALDAGALEKGPENKSFARAAGRIKSRTIAASARSRSSTFAGIGALETQLKQKSFTRRIRITHAMKRQHRPEGYEGVSNTSKPKTKRTLVREEDHQREDRPWLQRIPRSNSNLESQARKQPAVTNAIQPKKKRRQDRGEERQQRVSNQPQKKSHPLSDSDSDSDSHTQTLTQRKSKKTHRSVQHLGHKRVKEESIKKFDSNAVLNAKPPPRKSQPQFGSDSEPGSDSDSDSDSLSDPLTQAELRIQRKVQQKHSHLNRLDHKQEEQQESAAVKAEPLPVVVDLVSSDSESESESESCTNDLVLKLTQLLEYEAIGRGADRNEMQVYARHLFKLGLHSREMILDALSFNSNDLDDSHNATHTNTDMASDIVKKWKWMKPFHKTCFYRWVGSELKRFRSGTKIYKVFGDEEFSGKVVGYDSGAKLYKILYSDGDNEEMDHNEVRNHLKRKRRRIKKRKNRY